MLNQENLLLALGERANNDTNVRADDLPKVEQRMLELTALLNYMDWTAKAQDDQEELETIVASLEKNEVLGHYGDWRQRATEGRKN